MKTYIVCGRNQANVVSAATHFANGHDGQVGPVEVRVHVRCDELDNHISADTGADDTVYMCRVDY